MTQRKKEKLAKERATKILVGLIFLEVAVFASLIFSVLVPSLTYTIAIAGEGNVTVQTFLQVGNVYPEVLNVTIYGGASSFDLTPNATTLLDIFVVMRDYNGEDDIQNVSLRFFDLDSDYGDPDDKNNHYTNSSCVLDTAYGDIYEVSANCTLNIEYYANNATWNATAEVTDNVSWTGRNSDLIVINELLAFALPDSLDYGRVNATSVSGEKTVNVTNAGNVILNLSLFGYGYTEGDGLAMNCTIGNIRNISIEYERYNLTISNTTHPLSFADFNSSYKGLTSDVVINQFDLARRTNDTHIMTDEYNATYWRIYVPIGVAGNCSGNIVFGAVQFPAS
jgi:hypothetical protein